MKKLEVTLEILETKELTTIAMIVDKSGTTATIKGDGNTTVFACCTCSCC